jgi:hypothetical protein
MSSLIDELQRREAAAREEAEELRGRITQLTGRLAQADERLSRLVIARETVEEVLNGAGSEAAVTPDGEAPYGPAMTSQVGSHDNVMEPRRHGRRDPGRVGGTCGSATVVASATAAAAVSV